MSARLATGDRMTVEQYLDWCRAQPKGRYELVDGVPFRMSPERNIHALAKSAVFRALSDAADGITPTLVVFVDGPTIPTGTFQAREPDIVVHPRAGIDWDAVKLDEPVILVEVVSPSSVMVDARDKLSEYFSLPSVVHYLIVDPGARLVVHHRRGASGMMRPETISEGTLRLDPPGLKVDVLTFFSNLPPMSAT